jgi:hypothetical protein
MQRLKADAFFKAYEQAAAFHQYLVQVQGDGLDIEQDSHVVLMGQLVDLDQELTKFGMNSAAVCVRRATDVLRTVALGGVVNGKQRVTLPSPDAGKVQNWLVQATSRIADNFSQQCVLVLAPEMLRYYQQPKLFGDAVFDNFESATDDIIEAGNCLALGRGTACVMHLMRVLEAGLKALAGALEIERQNDWGSYIREINRALAVRGSMPGPKSPDAQFYAEMAAQFEYLKRAWRNPSMHIDRAYGIDRAGEILLAVKSFMGLLATKLKEAPSDPAS